MTPLDRVDSSRINRSSGPSGRGQRLQQWLERPLPAIWCLLSWIGSSALFFAIVGVLGGPTEGDAAESVYSTWAVAHGHFACMYPPGHYRPNELANPFSLTAPLYPLFTGAISFLLRVGHSVAFPTSSQLGANCSTALVAMYKWSVRSSVAVDTVRLSYIVWPVLLAGVVMLIRASGKGRRGWEVVGVFSIACTIPVFMCIVDFFHPQDVLTMGLIVASLALALRHRWAWAGVIVGLAISSQQFALLAAVPLFVIAPRRDRLKYATGVIATAGIIDVPLVVLTSGRAFKTILLGSSRAGSNIRSTGGTVLWELNPHGAFLFIASRILPIVTAALLAWWFTRRRTFLLSEPQAVLSLLALSLGLRLVFEINLFGYYFMALSVMLILIDIVEGHLRGQVVAWIGLATLAFNPVHWGFFSNWTTWEEPLYFGVPIAFLAIAILFVAVDMTQHTHRWYKILWIILVCVTSESEIFGRQAPFFLPPNWLWQLVLVPTGMWLAASPLLKQKTIEEYEMTSL